MASLINLFHKILKNLQTDEYQINPQFKQLTLCDKITNSI